MKPLSVILLYGCLWATAGPTPVVAAEDLSAQQLIELAPVITETNPQYRSIEISGSFRLARDADMGFRLLYRAPNRYVLACFSSHDGVPFMYISQKKLLIYEPVTPTVTLHKTGPVVFHFSGEGKGLTFACGSLENDAQEAEPAKDGDPHQRVLLDLKSLFGGEFVSSDAVKLSNGRYRLTQTSQKGNRLVAVIDPTKPCPYSRAWLEMAQAGNTSLVLDSIQVNHEIDDASLAFPDLAPLAQALQAPIFQDLSDKKGMELVIGMTQMYRGGLARLAIHHESMRDIRRYPFMAGIDWQRTKQNDVHISAILQKAIGVTPPQPITPEQQVYQYPITDSAQ